MPAKIYIRINFMQEKVSLSTILSERFNRYKYAQFSYSLFVSYIIYYVALKYEHQNFFLHNTEDDDYAIIVMNTF